MIALFNKIIDHINKRELPLSGKKVKGQYAPIFTAAEKKFQTPFVKLFSITRKILTK